MLKTILNSFLAAAICSHHRMCEAGISLGVLADNPLCRVSVSDNEALRHLLVSEAPGPGVTALIEDVLNQRTKQGLGWVYLDPDQDYGLRDRLYSTAVSEKREDEFFVIDLASPENGYSFDLLDGTPADVASELAEVLASDEHSPGVEFYKQVGRFAMELILEAFLASGRKYTLDDLFAVMMDKNAAEALIQVLPDGSDILQRLTDFNRKHMAEDKVRYMQLLPIASRLAQLNTLERKNVLNNTRAQVSLKEVLLKNQLCVITLPTGDDMSVAGRVLLAKLKHTLQERATLPARLRKQVATVCLPKSNTYLTPKANSLFSQARAYGVSLLATWANLATGDAAPPQLDGNTWTKIEFESSAVPGEQFKVVIGDKESQCKHAPVVPVPRVAWSPKTLPTSVDYRYPLDLHRITKGIAINE